MCGIFGLTTKNNSKYRLKDLKKINDFLFKLSESRGKEASGLAIRTDNSFYVLKSPYRASDFIKCKAYKNFWDRIYSTLINKRCSISLSVIGHSRLATQGNECENDNNQPVVKNGAVCVHNGIITNDSQLWLEHPDLKRKYKVDTEIFLALFKKYLSVTNSLDKSIKALFKEIKGSASIAVMFEENREILLATNTGSLYYIDDPNNDIFIFASENYILEKLIRKIRNIVNFNSKINKLKPGTALILDLNNSVKSLFNFTNSAKDISNIQFKKIPKDLIPKITEEKIPCFSHVNSISSYYKIRPEIKKEMMKVWENIYSGSGLRRCRKCLYPETMPFIKFNEDNICNYCKLHKPIEIAGEEKLKEIIEPYRRNDGKSDCIVPFSGGRDSSYGLYYIKEVLKMNPVAYTYDWGVMTDLGRKNEARICGALGVEHIINSANIKKKRENIKKNLNAWLKNPKLGMVPLLMAGDKQLLYYTQQLGKKLDTNLIIYSASDTLEEEPFKIGFCGIPRYNIVPHQSQHYSLSNRLKTAKYYIPQYFLNNAYFNSSFFDSLFAFYSYFIFREKNHLQLFNYIRWDEEKILKTIINKYGWERANDTKTTWRIDDGTAPLYNYIYMTVAGFTENDTFRSRQIRDNEISREKAYELVKEENRPRFESLEWYARIIDVDINKVIKRINEIPRLYFTTK